VLGATSAAFDGVLLVIGVLVGWLAYRESENFKRKNGVTPRHWPSGVWAVIGFLSLVLAAILLTIARRTTKPVTGPTAGPWPPGAPFPAPPPGWYPDPSGRHEHRYWDGARWTEHVSTAGTAGVDPPG
jgi:hypothetical protein